MLTQGMKETRGPQVKRIQTAIKHEPISVSGNYSRVNIFHFANKTFLQLSNDQFERLPSIALYTERQWLPCWKIESLFWESIAKK